MAEMENSLTSSIDRLISLQEQTLAQSTEQTQLLSEEARKSYAAYASYMAGAQPTSPGGAPVSYNGRQPAGAGSSGGTFYNGQFTQTGAAQTGGGWFSQMFGFGGANQNYYGSQASVNPLAALQTGLAGMTGGLSAIMNNDNTYIRSDAQSAKAAIDARTKVGNFGTDIVSGAASMGGAALGMMAGGLPGAVIGTGIGMAASGLAENSKESRENRGDWEKMLIDNSKRFIDINESEDKWSQAGMSTWQRSNAVMQLDDSWTNFNVSDSELKSLFNTATDTGMFAGVSNEDEMVAKLKEIAESSKDTSRLLGTSVEQSAEILGNFQRYGIDSQDALGLSAGAQAAASMTGMTTENQIQTMLNTTGAMSQMRFGLNTESRAEASNLLAAASGAAYSAYDAGTLDEDTVNRLEGFYATNTTAEDRANATSSAIMSAANSELMLGVAANYAVWTDDGKGGTIASVDRDAMERDLASGMTYREIADAGKSKAQEWTKEQQAFFYEGGGDTMAAGEILGAAGVEDIFNTILEESGGLHNVMFDALGIQDANQQGALTALMTQDTNLLAEDMGISTEQAAQNAKEATFWEEIQLSVNKIGEILTGVLDFGSWDTSILASGAVRQGVEDVNNTLGGKEQFTHAAEESDYYGMTHGEWMDRAAGIADRSDNELFTTPRDDQGNPIVVPPKNTATRYYVQGTSTEEYLGQRLKDLGDDMMNISQQNKAVGQTGVASSFELNSNLVRGG